MIEHIMCPLNEKYNKNNVTRNAGLLVFTYVLIRNTQSDYAINNR